MLPRLRMYKLGNQGTNLGFGSFINYYVISSKSSLYVPWLAYPPKEVTDKTATLPDAKASPQNQERSQCHLERKMYLNFQFLISLSET